MTDYLKIIKKIQTEKSKKQKITLLKQFEDDECVRKFIYYLLNPLITYNISEKTLKEINNSENVDTVLCFSDIFDCCRYLSRLKSMDKSTLKQVNAFLNCFENEERELYIKLLSKTLRLGVTAKTINSVWGDFIPVWEVQQAYSIENHPIKPNGEIFWLTQKLNGVRATFFKGKMISRSGSVYTGLDHLFNTEIVKFAKENNYILDGELTIKNKESLSDNEAFRVATGIINSDSDNKTEICYTVFDIIPEDEFINNSPSMLYSKRREIMDSITELNDDNVKVLPTLYHGNDVKYIDELLEAMVKSDKEGLMLNFDVPYKRKRHSGILKVKRFYTLDLRIIGFEEGTGRLSGTLGSIIVDYNGNDVKVGSGISDDLRQSIWNNQEEYKNRVCEVKYKEISYDKKTKTKSLQFPVFIGIRYDKEDISFD